ncbi:hypothetical protein ZWY2020_028966 [Hordeum vulgare]|nr:hypothetical protein ZWY2020_028966 [Hordeum vulgare]
MRPSSPPSPLLAAIPEYRQAQPGQLRRQRETGSHSLPKAATRSRRKINSDEQDVDFIPHESIPQKQKEKTTVKKTMRKEYAKHAHMKALESRLANKPGQKRTRERIVHFGRRTSMYESPTEHADDEEEIPAEVPPPKKKKLMVDAMPKKPYAPKKSLAPKKSVAPKRSGHSCSRKEQRLCIHRVCCRRGRGCPGLMKPRAHLPLHNDAHTTAEDMKKRRDQGLRKWRSVDPYFVRRRIAIDPRFHKGATIFL